MISDFSSSTLLFNSFQLTRKDLTKELWNKYSSELMTMITSQYYNKDPSSRGLTYMQLYQYFKEEYDEISQMMIVSSMLFFSLTKKGN